MLALAACGSSGTEGSAPTALIAAAIQRSDDAGSYRADVDLASDLAGQHEAIRGEMLANGDSTRLRGRFVYEEGEDDPIEMEMILVGEDAYYRGREFAKVLPPGREWMHLRDKELGQQSLTPGQLIDLLRDTEGVEEIGSETIRGHETVRLRGPFDVEEAADRLGGPMAEKLEKSPELVKRLNATVDAWVSENDKRLHRVAVRMTFDGVGGAMSMTTDLLEEGAPLDDVKAPPARLVADEDELETE